MISPLSLSADYHVHSVFSDGASTLAQNVQAAADRGLVTMCLADHVRAGSSYVPRFAAAVARLRPAAPLELLAGVEAKILDGNGRLDLPPLPDGIDLVLIADHQFPGPGGPVHPARMRELLAAGQISASSVIADLIGATTAALDQAPARPLLAHLFSLLPRMGLAEADVPGELVAGLARRAGEAGALAEVNEKRGCPSPRVAGILAAAGVPLVASTDSHHCRHVGQYASVRRTAQELLVSGPA